MKSCARPNFSLRCSFCIFIFLFVCLFVSLEFSKDCKYHQLNLNKIFTWIDFDYEQNRPEQNWVNSLYSVRCIATNHFQLNKNLSNQNVFTLLFFCVQSVVFGFQNISSMMKQMKSMSEWTSEWSEYEL